MTLHSDLDVTVDTYLAAWTEGDAGQRAALIERVWADDSRLNDPPFVARGRRSISQLAAVRQVEHPGYTFRRVNGVEADDEGLCFAWQFVGPDGTAAIEGVDVGELGADGRLRRVTRRYGRWTNDPGSATSSFRPSRHGSSRNAPDRRR
jgi:SnoaL-like domain